MLFIEVSTLVRDISHAFVSGVVKISGKFGFCLKSRGGGGSVSSLSGCRGLFKGD